MNGRFYKHRYYMFTKKSERKRRRDERDSELAVADSELEGAGGAEDLAPATGTSGRHGEGEAPCSGASTLIWRRRMY